MEFSPFREGDTYSTFSHHLLRAIEEINSLDNEYVLKASDTELETHYIEKVTFEPIRIDESDFYIEERRSTKIDVSHDFNRGGFGREHIEVPGTELLIAIPFEGDSGLLRLDHLHSASVVTRQLILKTTSLSSARDFPTILPILKG